MHNIKMDVKGKILTITVDLAQEGQPSKTSQGKNMVVAGSGGFQSIPGLTDNTKISLNIIRPSAK